MYYSKPTAENSAIHEYFTSLFQMLIATEIGGGPPLIFCTKRNRRMQCLVAYLDLSLVPTRNKLTRMIARTFFSLLLTQNRLFIRWKLLCWYIWIAYERVTTFWSTVESVGDKARATFYSSRAFSQMTAISGKPDRESALPLLCFVLDFV
jgi:hypothetical protein